MPFSGIAGHTSRLAILRRILASSRIAHAYLLTGPDGIGKKKIATAFVEAIFCGKPEGCGSCASCLRIASGNHPDLHLVVPDGQFIKVAQIRELQRELALRPYEAPRKACIIDGADRMNPSAGNSLLKTLEEPPGNTIMILLAATAEAVLPTIRSRCQTIPFMAVSTGEIAAFLTASGVDPRTAQVAASLAEGSIARALGLCSEEIMAERSELLTGISSLSRHSYTELFAFGERFDKDRDKAVQSLDIILSFWRDMLHLRSGATDIINRDLAGLLHREASRRTTVSLIRGIDAALKTRQAILRNANVRLAMDVLCMEMAA